MKRILQVAAAGALATAVLARRRTVSVVPPELRTVSLWLPLSVTGPVSLAVGRAFFDRSTEPAHGVDVQQQEVPGGAGVIVYRPTGPAAGPRPTLLWIHGGGTIIGSPEGDHELCSGIAKDLDLIVVSVRYRLAPEHRFPAAHDDAFAALRWVHSESSALGIDPARAAVGGASAGGGIAAGVVQRALDEGVPVALQLLVYPMLDDRTTLRPSAGRGRLSWTASSNAFAWRAYLGHAPTWDEIEPYAAPARRQDLRGLPAAWIGVGDLDLFFDEDVDYARRLESGGVPVDLELVPGMYHAADVALHQSVAAMSAFRASMHDALARGLGVQRRQGISTTTSTGT